eukprot:CAMPEP_0113944216 /NCGR_PEP_ID=MMETSP1339-20121228/31559_1 /TAXON_ID=94617 /ORGANISM="Fibrocapsa japonica" /LENGTH=195 /DNA_ID=CAMNT_0000949331 /DNA_START=234 /DNA_END=821 /DNA_ORIENTATION=+ /assembly_acc=CAM_ASM_000762
MPNGVIKRVEAKPSHTINDIKDMAGLERKKRLSLDEERTELTQGSDVIKRIGVKHGDILYAKMADMDGSDSASLQARLASTKTRRNRAGTSVPHADNMKDFDMAVKRAGSRLLVVDFYADWCGPCKQIAPVFEKMYQDNLKADFLKVNTDRNKAASQKYKVSAMPTFVFIKNGKVVKTLQGANEGAISQAINQYA